MCALVSVSHALFQFNAQRKSRHFFPSILLLRQLNGLRFPLSTRTHFPTSQDDRRSIELGAMMID